MRLFTIHETGPAAGKLPLVERHLDHLEAFICRYACWQSESCTQQEIHTSSRDSSIFHQETYHTSYFHTSFFFMTTMNEDCRGIAWTLLTMAKPNTTDNNNTTKAKAKQKADNDKTPPSRVVMDPTLSFPQMVRTIVSMCFRIYESRSLMLCLTRFIMISL